MASRDIKYKGYWVSLSKCEYADKYDILITDGTFYWREQVDRHPDRPIMLHKLKSLTEEGVNKLNKHKYPKTGSPI